MAKVNVKANFDMPAIKEYFGNYRIHIEEKAEQVLIILADKVADDARRNAEFMNHSYNLRSSIGTVVFRNGFIVHQNFKDVGGEDGYQKGIDVAEDNLPESGVGMMIVAGEDYAYYVEAIENKWVISGSSLRLAKLLQKLI